MIFIKISKKNIMRIVSLICVVLILGTGAFEVFRVVKLNDKFVEMNKKNVELGRKIDKLNEELVESDRWLKIKDDRIIELEEELEWVKELEKGGNRNIL